MRKRAAPRIAVSLLPAICALALLLPYHPARAQTVTITTPIHFKDGIEAQIAFTGGGNANPGRKILTVGGRSAERLKIERDANGLPTRYISDSQEVTVTDAEEEWAKEDANAFTLTVKGQDGSVLRRNTIAVVTVEGSSRLVVQSLYSGEAYRNHGKTRQNGDMSRMEFYSPSQGVGVTVKGLLIGGRFHSTTRRTTMTFRSNDTERIKRIISEERDGADDEWETLSDVHSEKKLLEGSWRDIKQVDDPDGAALTQNWEYYTTGQESGPDGHNAHTFLIKRHKAADGTETRYQYIRDGKITEVLAPGEPVMRTTDRFDIDAKTHSFVYERDGKETHRMSKRHEPGKVTTTTLWADGKEEKLIEEFYPSGKIFGGDPRRIIRPDGTISTYGLTKLPDGSVRKVEEHGRGDGDKVIEGTRTTTLITRGFVTETKTERIGGKTTE